MLKNYKIIIEKEQFLHNKSKKMNNMQFLNQKCKDSFVNINYILNSNLNLV